MYSQTNSRQYSLESTFGRDEKYLTINKGTLNH